MKRLAALTMLLAAVLWSGPLLAETGELILKDGSEKFGQVIRTSDGYQIQLESSSGVSRVMVTYKADQVKQFIPGTLMETFNRKRKALAKDDFDGIYNLARWSYTHELYPQVAALAEELLKINPDHANAKLMLTAAKRRMAATSQPDDDDKSTKPPVRPRVEQDALPKLTADQVDVIKLMEFRTGSEGERPESLRVAIDRGLVAEYLEYKQGVDPRFNKRAQREFQGQPPHIQLAWILRDWPPSQRPDLVKKVEVHDDPQALKPWRERIHPWVLNSCAAANCHGSKDQSTPWKLITTGSRTDELSVYTNFYVTSEFESKAGKLINRDRAEDSLLLQYAVASDAGSIANHPKVNGQSIRPALRGASDPTYRQILSWIRDWRKGGLKFPKPNYGINFPPNQGPQPPAGQQNPGRPAPQPNQNQPPQMP